ncbi:serine/threonine protein kinase, partial [Streptomyces sp. MUM 203J]|nr:serine/threonine protein kinase [Streptomyces sp. MUM 203J]
TVVSARPRSPQGRSRALVAAAVAAVVLAGAGIAYGLMDRETAASAGRGGTGVEGPGPADGRPEGGDGLPLTPGDGPPGSVSPGDSGTTASSAPASRSASGAPSKGVLSPSPARPAPGDATGPGHVSSSTTASGGGASGSADGGTGTPKPTCFARGDGRYDCTVWKNAKSYWKDGREAGILYAGKNYFYCQADLGRRVTDGRWTNVWWGRTDDDSRNAGVWVSIVYVQGGDNDGPVPGLPVC